MHTDLQHTLAFTFQESTLAERIPLSSVDSMAASQNKQFFLSANQFRHHYRSFSKYLPQLFYLGNGCPELYFYQPEYLCLIPTGIASFQQVDPYQLLRIFETEVRSIRIAFDQGEYERIFMTLPEAVRLPILKECLTLRQDLADSILFNILNHQFDLLYDFHWYQLKNIILQQNPIQKRAAARQRTYLAKEITIYGIAQEPLLCNLSEAQVFLWYLHAYDALAYGLAQEKAFTLVTLQIPSRLCKAFIGKMHTRIILDPEDLRNRTFDTSVFPDLLYYKNMESYRFDLKVGYDVLLDTHIDALFDKKDRTLRCQELSVWISALFMNRGELNLMQKRSLFKKILQGCSKREEFMEYDTEMITALLHFLHHDTIHAHQLNHPKFPEESLHLSLATLQVVIAVNQLKHHPYFHRKEKSTDTSSALYSITIQEDR